MTGAGAGTARRGGASERARLPFTPGEPRQPVDDVSSMYNDCALEIIDADLATGSAHLGSVKRAMILVDGDVSIPFIRDSIVIATGRVRSAFVDNSVVIAGGELRVSGGGRRFADGRGGGDRRGGAVRPAPRRLAAGLSPRPGPGRRRSR